MDYRPIFTDIRCALFSKHEDMAVEIAAGYFDLVEAGLRKKVGAIRGNADFTLVAGVICFLFFIKIVDPMLPVTYQNKSALIAYILFFVSVVLYPIVFYKLPGLVDISYLFRKEKFLHDFIDHYKLTIEKPILVDKHIRTSLLFVKVPVSKKTIAIISTLLLKVLAADPLKVVVKNV